MSSRVQSQTFFEICIFKYNISLVHAQNQLIVEIFSFFGKESKNGFDRNNLPDYIVIRMKRRQKLWSGQAMNPD